MAEIRTYRDADHLARAAAEHFISLAGESIDQRGRFSVALSGGSTPRAAYARLASPEHAGKIDWTRVHLFWGDERCVPPAHPDSNYRMVRHTLLERVPVPQENIHRMLGELDPATAARAYELDVRRFFLSASEEQGPEPSLLLRFDLVLLGLGPDGHTVSLFPGTGALQAQDRWVVENYVKRLGEWRLTLTPELINAAGQVTFLVSGAQKAEVVREVLLGPRRPEELPAQLITPARGTLLWMMDVPAGELLE